MNGRCIPKCRLDDLVYIAEVRHPHFPEEQTAKYSLIGCKSCGCLTEIRREPEEDKWGSSKSEESSVSYEYAADRYSISEEKIKAKLGI